MLETLDLFSSLSQQEIQEIAKITHRVEFKRNETIFQQGDSSTELFVIESGQVEISVKNFLQDVKVLARLKSGELFGEMVIFEPGGTRSATARAMQNSVLFVIPGGEFEQLLKSRPSMSFKLLGTLSRRLKETSTQAGSLGPAQAKPVKIISIAGPRNGVGKTTLAVTMAKLLAQMVPARTLFIDLDLPFADGTYYLGVHSVRTVLEFCRAAKAQPTDWDSLRKHLTQVGTNLFCLPGPVNIIDGEQVDPKALVLGIRQLQKFFDFIILDTDSRIDDVFLSAVDLSDRIFFVADTRNPYAVKSNLRYFFGLGKLNMAGDRTILLTNAGSDPADAKGLSGLLKMPVVGALPVIGEYKPEYGLDLSAVPAADAFCGFVRRLLHQSLGVVLSRGEANQGFFSRLFARETEPEPPKSDLPAAPSVTEFSTGFRDGNFRALLRSIRTALIAGQVTEAREAILQLIDLNEGTAAVFQMYGEILMTEERYSEAVEAFRKAVQLEPDCHLAMGFAGILSADKNLFAEATAILHKKIRTHPDWPDLHRDLGELHLRNQDLEDAASAFREAMRLNPRYEDARVRYAETLYSQGKTEETLTELRRMTQKNAPAFHLMGKCFQAIDRPSEALEAFRLLQRINPSYQDVSLRISDLQENFRKLNRLLSMHQRIRVEQPTYVDVRLKLAQLLSVVGRHREAEVEVRDAIALKPNHQPAHEMLESLRNRKEYIIDRPKEVEHPQHPCHGLVCKGFHVALKLGDSVLDPIVQERLANYQIGFRNIRTGKSFDFRLPPAVAPEMDVLASTLCPVTENDVIQVRLMNPQTGEVLFSHVQLIMEGQEPLCKIDLDLSEPLRRVAEHLPIITPIRYFFLRIPRKVFPGDVATEVQAILCNPRNGMEADAYSDPDMPGHLCFVLKSDSSEDAVREGDLLEIRSCRADQRGKKLFKIRVNTDDITAFCRLIADEDLEKTKGGEVLLSLDGAPEDPDETPGLFRP
jgi:CRP-like cAMP-binding protein/tetratricopeptide (TPR) repeat protein